jgi:5-methylcytosine-specific restriction enzyme subunit McrC
MQILTHIDFNIKSTDKQVFKQIGRNLKTQSFVGSIQIDKELIIEILPKFIKTDKELDDKSIQQYRNTLMNMIMLSGESKFLSSTNVALKNQNGELPMFETLIYFFGEALSNELRKGLHREYIKTSGNLTQMKGRLVMHEHLRRNMFDQAKLYVEYETFSIDNPLMQIFKSSVRLLLEQHQISPLTKQKLNEALYLLNDVSDIKLTLNDFEAIVFHRMNSRFEDLFAQCRFLIMKFFPFSITADSKTKFWSILFDMDELFEDFLAFLLSRSDISFEDQYNFHAYRAPQGSKNVGAQPDFVFYQENKIMSVADAKWKLYDPDRESSTNMGGLDWANFWQLTSYMYLLSKEPIPGYFIVPAKSKNVPREVHYPSPRDYHADIAVLTIDFTMPISDILETHKFSWDENNRLRLSAHMTAKLWVSRLLEELHKIRIIQETIAVEDETFYPYLVDFGKNSGAKITPLASMIINALDEVYTDAITHVDSFYGSKRSMDGFPYTQLANDLMDKLSPPIETPMPVEEPKDELASSDTTITWPFYESTINDLYDRLDQKVEYSRSIYASNLEKIKRGKLTMPKVDVKHFSINGKKIAIFHFERNTITVNFENFDITLTPKLKKDKLLKIASGLNYATVKATTDWIRFLTPLENYLNLKIAKEIGITPIGTLVDDEVIKSETISGNTSDETPHLKIESVEKETPIEKPQKDISEIVWFREACEGLIKTLGNADYLSDAMNQTGVLTDKKNRVSTGLPDISRTLTIGSKKLCSLTRLRDSVSIELDNIDDMAYADFIQDKTPFVLQNHKSTMTVRSVEKWNEVKNKLFQYLNKAVISSQKASLFDEIRPSKGLYNPASTLSKLNSNHQRYNTLYYDPKVFSFFADLKAPSSQKSLSAHSTIMERFVDAVVKDGFAISPSDLLVTRKIFDMIDVHPQLFKNLISRNWALQMFFDEDPNLSKLKPDIATYIADRMKESKVRIKMKNEVAIDEAIRIVHAKTNYANALQIVSMAAVSDLSEFSHFFVSRLSEAIEQNIHALALSPLLFSNETTPIETHFGYFFSRSFYKGQINPLIITSLAKAHERLLAHSPIMDHFIKLVQRRTNDFESPPRGNWANLSQSEKEILLSIAEMISVSKKLYFIWKTLAENTTNINILENIFENISGLSPAQRKIVFNAIIRAKIYQNASNIDALHRFGDLIHKILLYEDSMKDKNMEIIYLVSKSYSKNEESARYLYDYYRTNEAVFEELLKYSNVRSGEVSDLILEFAQNKVAHVGYHDQETDLTSKLKENINITQ